MSNTNSPKVMLIFTDQGKDYALLLLRLFFGIMIFVHGIQKAADFPALAQTFPDPIGLGSRFSLLIITITEIGGGALIAAGLLTRLAALALMIGMSVAAFVVHAPFTIADSELPLAYLAVFAALFLSGGGRYSADYYLRKLICGKTKA